VAPIDSGPAGGILVVDDSPGMRETLAAVL
jgi:hypothetical protein